MSLISLLKPHTHAGVLHDIGAELEVLEHEAEWLVKRGVARLRGVAATTMFSTVEHEFALDVAEVEPSVQADNPANTTGA